MAHQRWIARHRLLADNRRSGDQPREAFRQYRLALAVGHGDKVIGGLLEDLAGGKVLKTRQDGARGCLLHQPRNGGVQSGRQAHDL